MGILLLVAAGLLSGCRIQAIDTDAAAPSEDSDLSSWASQMMQNQAEAWHRGDLEGFLAGYDLSPSTIYVGAAGLVEGFEGIRDRYAPLFAPGAVRDSVRFEDLRVRQLDPRLGVVTARFVLHRNGQTTSSGPFTIVVMKVEGAWKIIHDHSSSDPDPESGP